MVWLFTVCVRAVVISAFRLIGATVRIIDDPIARFEEYHRQGHNVVFALWHEFSVVGIYWYRHRGGSALVDHSWRGDVLAGVLNHFGFQDFRISSVRRPRPNARGVLGFIRYLKQGHDGTIAMDGPVGPARRPKPGILHIAAKTGALIVPAGACFSHSIKLRNRWDNYQIPLPFSRVHLVFGDPIKVPPDFRSRESELLEELTQATTSVTEEAGRQARRYALRRKKPSRPAARVWKRVA